MRPATRIVILVLLVYTGAYLVFRKSHIETWERDGQAYVIYPEGYGQILYYVWRPLSYLDSTLTGMRFHIGPHR